VQVRVHAVELVVAALRDGGLEVLFELEKASEPRSHFKQG
jgi:hypothetical protein